MFVVDIDGTLLNGNNTISEEDKLALDEVRRQGIVVSLCTGRVKQACSEVIRRLALDGYHIFSDGAVVDSTDGLKQIYARSIEESLLKQMVEYVHLKGINTIDFFSPSGYYIEPETEPWVTEIRRNFFGLKPNTVDFADLCQHEQIIKATLVLDSAEDRAKAKEFLALFKDKLRFSWTGNATYPSLDFINIIDTG
ncbi:MAG: HAD hydrolase family protein, partial [Chloroflexota bacterium]